jgi:hypothetical protein
MRQAVYGTARLGLHREFSDRLKEAQGGGALPAWKSVASSMASGAIASVIGTPFDISLVRMQADSLKPPAERRGYKNVFDALGRIAREEGVPSLWRGFEPTVARAIAMNVGMMATYDVSRDAIRKVNGDGFSTQLAASATAAIACVTTSLPFDMIKVSGGGRRTGGGVRVRGCAWWGRHRAVPGGDGAGPAAGGSARWRLGRLNASLHNPAPPPLPPPPPPADAPAKHEGGCGGRAAVPGRGGLRHQDRAH